MLDKGLSRIFTLGLTQEEIGDATGLTNERALQRVANFADRYAGLDLSWLPASR